MENHLPDALIRSFEFSGLTPKQVSDFVARLRYIQEVTEKIDKWFLQDSSKGNSRESLEQLELDIAIIQSISDSPEEKSPWLIHTSWTFETRDTPLAGELETDIGAVIDEKIPGLKSDHNDFVLWLSHQNDALKATLGHFYTATSFRKVIACIIAMDTILANLLAGIYRCHLSR